jgi:hypothetical protein
LLPVVRDGAEWPGILSFLAVFSDPTARHIIETKKNFDKSVQIVSSQEIDSRETEQQGWNGFTEYHRFMGCCDLRIWNLVRAGVYILI